MRLLSRSLKYMTALAVMMLIPVTSSAEECPTAHLQVDFVSQYVSSTTGAVNSDKPSLQPSAAVVFCPTESGVVPYASMWWQTTPGHGGFNSEEGAEGDLFLGVTKVFENGTFVDGGVALFAFPALDEFSNDTVQPYGTFGRSYEWSEMTVTPYTTFEYVHPLDADLSSGVNVYFGVKGTYQAGKASPYANVYAIHDSGSFNNDAGWIGHGMAGVDFAVGGGVRAGPFVKVASPISSYPERETELVVGMSIKTDFDL